MDSDVNKVLGSITAHLIRTGSGQELQKATISTNLHTFFAYLQNAVEEQCNVHERDEGLPKRERTCIEQENFESGEGLSSPVEHSSIQGSSPPESQASFQLPTGSGYSVRLDRIMPEPVTNIVILTFLKSITSSRKGKEGKLHWNPKPMQFRIANGHTNCIAINDGTFKPRVNNGAVWIDDPEALAYASLETKSRFDDWNDNVGGQSAKVKAQEAAEILGMMHQRISRLSSTQQLNRLSAFDRTVILVSGVQHYLLIKGAIIDVEYLTRFFGPDAPGALDRSESSFFSGTVPSPQGVPGV